MTAGGKSKSDGGGKREKAHARGSFARTNKLSLFGFFALTAAMVLSVHEYPTFAVAGMQIPFFLILTGFLWFLPVALCSAEMATVKGWEEEGIFTWVGTLLGERFGFAAVFFQWFQITVCFVTVIYFMLSALSYLFGIAALDNDPLVKCLCVLAIFWALSLVQLKGIRRTSHIARLGFILGVIAPTVILFVLGVMYFVEGKPSQLGTEPSSVIPDFTQIATLVVMVSFIFANMGAEASASHINEMKNPKRNYPLAMVLLVVLSIVLNAIGGFTVAGVVPLDQLSLSGGMVQTFEGLIMSFGEGFGWMVKVVCALLVIGVTGEVSSWIVGPSRALYATAERGYLPKHLLGLNKNGVPARIIVLQAVVVSVWAIVLTLLGGGNNLSYLAALTLTTLIYLVAYIMMFVAYLRLIRHPEYQRGFHVPGGIAGKILFAGMGLFSSLAALCLAFVPSSIIVAEEVFTYEMILVIGFVITLFLPFGVYGIYSRRVKRKDRASRHPRHLRASEVNVFTRLSGRGEHAIASEEKKLESP